MLGLSILHLLNLNLKIPTSLRVRFLVFLGLSLQHSVFGLLHRTGATSPGRMKGEALAIERGTHTFSAGEGVPAPQLVNPSPATGSNRLHHGQIQALPRHPSGRYPRRSLPAGAHCLVHQCGLCLVLAGALADGRERSASNVRRPPFEEVPRLLDLGAVAACTPRSCRKTEPTPLADAPIQGLYRCHVIHRGHYYSLW